jgi:glycosyltransferase involved in cell wall biosynthesis
VEDIALKMEQLYKDENLRTKLIANAREQVKKFSWDKSAERLWDCVMKCVGK